MSRRPGAPLLLLLAGLLLAAFALGRGASLLLLLPAAGLTWYGASLWAQRLSPEGRARARRLSDGAYFAFVAAYAAAALLFLLAGLAPALAHAFPSLHEALHRWGGVETGSVRVVASGNAFNTDELDLPRRGEVVIQFTNLDVGVQHNVSIYRVRQDVTALMFKGRLIRGTANIGYRFGALPRGAYVFVCDVHPSMRGVVRTGLAPGEPASPPPSGLRGVAARIATVSHGPRGESVTGGEAVSGGEIAVTYTFSTINFALALLLLRLRPRDRTARLLALGMLGTAAVFNAQAHAAFDVLPGGLTSFAHETFHEVSGVAYMFGLLLFPNGRFPQFSSSRWLRAILRPAFAFVFGVVGLFFVSGFHGTDPAGYVAFFGVIIPAAGISSQGFRYRHAASEEERVQSRVLVWALALAFGGAVAIAGLIEAVNLLRGAGNHVNLDRAVFLIFPVLFVVIPLTLVVVLVRYRLWDMGRVINKALVYGVLATFITAVYVAIVVGVGSAVGSGGDQNLGLSILAAALVAVAFEPLRVRLQRLANVLVYGKRSSPYEILADFSERMAGSLSVEEVLPRMAEAAARGVGAERARVRVFLPDGGVRSETWPPGADDDERFDRTLTIRHQGRPVGDVWVRKGSGESLTPAEEGLLGNLASQAGLALRNVRLTAELQARLEEISRHAQELRASRQRIVAAQDAAARRLERDIHDGAQQQLVALAVKLGLARGMVTRDPERAERIFSELQSEVQETLENLRDLARGIYPPLLADRGLAAALEGQARKIPVPVEVTCDGLLRYAPEVEAAVYFCCLEALQNVVKHARGSGAVVRLEAAGGELRFSVEDEGPGFDPAGAASGSGVQNMSDRVAALGGSLLVTSEPGRGTTVAGRLPARPLAGADQSWAG